MGRMNINAEFNGPVQSRWQAVHKLGHCLHMAVTVAHTAGPASLLLSVRAGISSGRKAAALAVAASDSQAT